MGRRRISILFLIPLALLLVAPDDQTEPNVRSDPRGKPTWSKADKPIVNTRQALSAQCPQRTIIIGDEEKIIDGRAEYEQVCWEWSLQNANGRILNRKVECEPFKFLGCIQ